jgi:small multidrug resistance family-3 protein
MPPILFSLTVFAGAAVAEIAGCFAFWVWLRQGKSALWLIPGVFSLMTFAYLLTMIPSVQAGKAYAAYGGIYIFAPLLWLWLAESHQPDGWDLAGSGLAVAGAMIILFAPRS